jgi:DNA polymerase elongation subunit (family B)
MGIITGRIVGESYKNAFNRSPDLIFWVRTSEGKIKVSLPSPVPPRYYVKNSEYKAIEAVLGGKVGYHLAREVPLTEAVIADEQEEAVVEIRVHDPPAVAIHRKMIEAAGYKAFEADLPYTRLMKKILGIYNNRVMVRNGEYLPYQGEVPDMVRGYYDIETNDEDMKKKQSPAKNRIICISLIIVRTGQPDEVLTFCGDDEVNDILKPFLKKLEEIDLLIGWGSEDFDDDFINTRPAMFGLQFERKSIQYLDLLKVMQFRGGKRMESMRLEYAVNEFLVKDRKWYEKTVQRLKGYHRYFKNQGGKDEFGNEINRETLKRTNLSHAQAVRDIDKAMEFSDLRISLADVGGIQVADTYYQSRVIDSLVLRRFYNERPRLIARCRDENVKKERYKGAQVFPTVPGQHDNVLHFDLVSLYNRIVQTFNISPELWSEARKKNPQNYEELIPLLQPQKDGIFPQEMKKLEKWRAELKAEKKKYEDNKESGEYRKASMMDNTVKTLILAFYGQLGEPRSRYFVNLMAGLVTYCGREIIMGTAQNLIEQGFDIIYGDTDSLFVKENSDFAGAVTDHEALGGRIKNYLNKEFYPQFLEKRWKVSPERKRIEIGFEEVYDTIFFGESKKRYAGWAHGAVKAEVVGFEQIRSDWCPLAKDTQLAILNMRLKKQPKDEIKSYIMQTKNELLDGKFTTQLIISKGMGRQASEYKALPPHIRAAMKMEQADLQGDYKIHFVITKASHGTIEEVAPVPDRTKVPPIEISGRVYYWNHQCWPPLERVLWGLFDEKEISAMSSCAAKEPSRLDFWLSKPMNTQ